jgi:hypothetical protein
MHLKKVFSRITGFCLLKILIPDMTHLEKKKKIWDPYYGKPTHTELTRSSASSLIFDLELKQKCFCSS